MGRVMTTQSYAVSLSLMLLSNIYVYLSLHTGCHLTMMYSVIHDQPPVLFAEDYKQATMRLMYYLYNV